MKYIQILTLIFILASCQKQNKEVVLKYPNGKALKEHYFEIINNKKELVKEIRYFVNGAKEIEGEYKDGKKNGKWTYWFENGNKWMTEHYKKDLKDGTNTVWLETGKLNYEGNFTNGIPDGEWIYYDESGKKIMRTIYKKGEKIKEEVY